MKKGITNAVVILLGAITLLMFSAYVTWTFIYGGEHDRPDISELESEPEKYPAGNECLKDDKCKDNTNGAKCLYIADPNFPKRLGKFCSCNLNEHCKSTSEVTRGSVCGQDNKCS